MAEGITVRAATPADLSSVLGVLDAAALETDAGRVRTAVDRGDVLVAVPSVSETPVGALVLDGDEITAVAVRRRRRGQGIGTALVETAADRVRADPDRGDRLVAAFDERVRPFYDALGFRVQQVGDGRYRGVLDIE